MPGRIWEPYLTDQDRAHLTKSEHRPIRFGESPALLLIDLYRWVFGDKPQPIIEALDHWPASCGLAGWESIPHVQTLLAAARGHRHPRRACHRQRR